MERDGAREATRAAREAYQQCRAAYDERAAPVKELQQQRADAVSSATKLRESFRWVLLATAWLGPRALAFAMNFGGLSARWPVGNGDVCICQSSIPREC